jgi:hypothetical protein
MVQVTRTEIAERRAETGGLVMIRCLPASGDTKRERPKTGWTLSGRSGLRLAVLVFFAGAFLAAVTVAAAREPDSQATYGPPHPPAAAIAPDVSPDGDTISGTAMSPSVASSSWVMGPLPEGDAGVAISATVMSPVTTTSMVTAAPR